MTKEEKTKEFMIGSFVPALRRVLNANLRIPGLFAHHYGNCCNQTAVLTCRHLSKVMPEYKWEMYEAIFRIGQVPFHLQFNHAWVYGINRRGINKNLFLNLAEDGVKITWEPVLKNAYPSHCTHGWYAQEVAPYRRQIDWETLSKLEKGEYYTGLPVQQLYDLVMQEALHPTSRDMSWYDKFVQARADIMKKKGFKL